MSQAPGRWGPTPGTLLTRNRTPPPPDGPRALIVGRYALYGEIASGGMATVHFGRLLGPAGFSRMVAIKRLHPQLAKETEFVSMFLDEVRLAARVQHPNVVATLDVVEEAGELFLVMEYVHGESLAQLIRLARLQGVQVPPGIACSVACGLLHGLHAAHEATSESGEPLGLIHRDVSPQNVLVGSDGVTRVLDFGIARAAGRLQTTREGQVKGKTAYLAPERIHGCEADRRSDVYGASVVLWETLTGVRLFDGENDGMVLAQVLSSAVTPPSALVPEIPEALEAITMRGMDRDPDRRFSSAREMALALQQHVGLLAPSEVGDWVSSIAADQLSRRARYIAQLDNATPSDPPASSESNHPRALLDGREPFTRVVNPHPSEHPAVEVGRGATSFARSDSSGTISSPFEPVRKRRGARIMGALVVVAAAASATLAVMRLRHAPSAMVPPSLPAQAAAPALPAVVAAEVAGPVDKPVEAVAEPARAILPDKTVPKGAQGARPAPSRAAPRPTATSATIEPRDPCRPPYTVDSSGMKHFKVDCVIDGRR